MGDSSAQVESSSSVIKESARGQVCGRAGLCARRAAGCRPNPTRWFSSITADESGASVLLPLPEHFVYGSHGQPRGSLASRLKTVDDSVIKTKDEVEP